MSERQSSLETSFHGVSRTFLLGQRIIYSYSAPVTDLRQLLRTIPPPIHGVQRRRRWHCLVNGVETSETRVSSDSFSNMVVEATVSHVADVVEFIVEVEVELAQEVPTYYTIADRRYLRHTRLTAPDAAIADLAAGAEKGDIASLCARVHQALKYEWGVTGVTTTASEALAGGRGVCQDYVHIMLAACRHAGLPARYVSGHVPGEGGSHAWVEVLHPQAGHHRDGWIVEGWDPTHNRRANSDYLVVAVGRDYVDVAPLSGTYSGDGVTSTLTVDKRLHLA